MIRIVINTKQDIRIRVNICNSFNIVCHFHELAIWKNRVCGWEKRDRAKGKCFALSMFSLLLDWIQSHCQLYNCVCVFSTPVLYIVHPDFICVIERVSSHWMRTPISLCLQTFPACSESVVCVLARRAIPKTSTRISFSFAPCLFYYHFWYGALLLLLILIFPRPRCWYIPFSCS